MWVLTDGRANLLRTATPSRYFSNFFDLQARALLHGRLSLADNSLGIESFIVHGRTYTYFPPFPSLLRLPVFMFTDKLDGQLTAPMMIAAWLITALACASFFARTRRLACGTLAVSRGEAFAYGALMLVLLGGSNLIFLASSPWVYHEVYAWAIALVMGAVAATLAVLERPTNGRVALCAFFTLAAVLTRSTGGWACVAMLVLLSIHLRGTGSDRGKGPRWWMPAALGAVALMIGMAVNYAKFGNVSTFDLQTQVWTRLNAQRQRSLIVNDGSLIGPQFFRSSVRTYLDPTGIRFTGVFPYITLPSKPPTAVSDVWIDQTYRTGGVPAFAPLSSILFLWSLYAVSRRCRVGRLALARIPLLGAALTTTGVMFYGYLAHRYTSEFYPLLVVGSIVGMVDITDRLRSQRRAWRRVATAMLVLGTSFGVAAHLAISVPAGRLIYRSEPLKDFVRLQAAMTVSHLDVVVAERAPAIGVTDRYVIIGECRALLLGTGDSYEPWVLVEAADVTRARSFETADRSLARSTVLMNFAGDPIRSVLLETDGFGGYRSVITGLNTQSSPWRPIGALRGLSVTANADTANGEYRFRTSAGDEFGIDTATWNVDWYNSVATLQAVGSSDPAVRDTVVAGPTCRAVRDR